MRVVIYAAFFGLVLGSTGNAQFSVSGPGDLIPTNGVNTGSSAGWDVENLDHDLTLTDSPGISTVVVPVPVSCLDSVEFQGLAHSWMGDLQCVLWDPNGVGYNIFLRPELEVGEICCGNNGDFLGGTYRFVEPGTSANGPLPQTGDADPGDWDQSWQSWDEFFDVVWPEPDENVFNVPLSEITGPAGVWAITFYDWASGDSGSFSGWTLNGNSCAPGPGQQYCPGDGIWPHTPCPFGNDNDGSVGGCYWGDPLFPGGGVLQAHGTSSMAGGDTYLHAYDLPNDFGLFFGGDDQVHGGNGNPLNDGLRCAGTCIERLALPMKATDHTLTLGPLQLADVNAYAGHTRRYQLWFRSPTGPGGTGGNLTNGYEIAWTH